MDYEKLVMGIALALVTAILFWGVITMGRGGSYNRNNSNKIMRYRIIFQAIALLIFVVILWLRRPVG
ncbi:MAG: twin transmembrane helix small protein [Candidatus Puniceispirillaceae bacterium]